MIRQYLELSRLFNMGLTGVAPVLGALAMLPEANLHPLDLLVLFTIGCLAHIYGFVLNDVIDVKIDKLSVELTARPLVNGSITRKKAIAFAIGALVLSYVLTLKFFAVSAQYFLLLFVLTIAYVSATIYDILSKRFPGTDVFVAGAVFFLILCGSCAFGIPSQLLPWAVAIIGSMQVLFMNMINGAIKDIDHDTEGQARTMAIWLGAKVHAGVMALPVSFRTMGYAIEVGRSAVLLLPFLLLPIQPHLWQIPLLAFFIVLTFLFIYRLFSIKTFNRTRIRKGIGVIVIVMYATTPIMLSYLDPRILLVALVPPVWFLASNVLLHKTLFEPKTM